MTPPNRYARQARFGPIGDLGQQRLGRGRVLIVGVGALGSVLADLMVRAGVGFVRLVDRDFVEITNLQRQVLFDEADAAAVTPKALAAQRKLLAANSTVRVEACVEDLTHRNIARLAGDIDAVLDGTDNFEARLLINDFCASLGIPWFYGGVIGAEGQTMPILPGETACLACLVPHPPAPGSMPTCDTAGVLGPAVHVIAAHQAVEAIKLLSGNVAAVSRRLNVIDLWTGRNRQLDTLALRESGDCRVCHRRDFAWLEGRHAANTAVLCGRGAVQLTPNQPQAIDLANLASSLRGLGTVVENPFLVRLKTAEHELTIFADGRAIVGGVEDETAARVVYTRFVGA